MTYPLLQSGSGLTTTGTSMPSFATPNRSSILLGGRQRKTLVIQSKLRPSVKSFRPHLTGRRLERSGMRRKNGSVCANALFAMNDTPISASDEERANYYADNPEARVKANGAKIKAEVQRLKEEEESRAKQLGREPFTHPVLADTTFIVPSVTPSSDT